jgi:hypothetical protein
MTSRRDNQTLAPLNRSGPPQCLMAIVVNRNLLALDAKECRQVAQRERGLGCESAAEMVVGLSGHADTRSC